jgi:hypothetical protein
MLLANSGVKAVTLGTIVSRQGVNALETLIHDNHHPTGLHAKAISSCAAVVIMQPSLAHNKTAKESTQLSLDHCDVC